MNYVISQKLFWQNYSSLFLYAFIPLKKEFSKVVFSLAVK